MAEANGGQVSQAIVMRADDEIEAFPSGADVRASTGLDALARSEIDVQVATAHRYPRNIALAIKRAESMAVLDEETAISCFYVLPRDGKNIEGPSVRLAEIFASSWGNMRAGSRLVDEGDKFILAQGFCHDLETNNAYGAEVAQRITKKNGQKFNDDMIGVAAAAAQAKAYRNAVFKVIPRAYINKVMRAAKAVAVGDATTLVNKRTKAIEWFAKVGVGLDRILARLGRASLEEIILDDIAVLLGLSTAIRDRMTTPDEAFPPIKAVTPGAQPEQKSPSATVAEHVAAVAAQAKVAQEGPTMPAAGNAGQAPGPAAQPTTAAPAPKPDKPDVARTDDTLSEAALAIDLQGSVDRAPTLPALAKIEEKIKAAALSQPLKTTLLEKVAARRASWGK